MATEIDYAQIIEDAFKENGWNFSTRKRDDSTVFSLPMSAKNCPGLNIRLEIDEDGDCKIRCYLADDTPKDKHNELIEMLNGLNNRYRYVTLSLDSDGDILAAYDFQIVTDEPELIDKQVGGMVVLLARIMDKCIPPIMKIIWADDDEDED